MKWNPAAMVRENDPPTITIKEEELETLLNGKKIVYPKGSLTSSSKNPQKKIPIPKTENVSITKEELKKLLDSDS